MNNHKSPERSLNSSCCQNQATHVPIHRSWRSIVPFLLGALLIVSLVLANAPGSILTGGLITIPGTDFTLRLPLLLLIVLVLLARPTVLIFDCNHELTCNHLRSTTGRMSIKTEHIEVPIANMRGVRVIQKWWEHLVNIGTIIAWTGTAEKPEVVMRGIANPAFFANKIAERIDSTIGSRKTPAKDETKA